MFKIVGSTIKARLQWNMTRCPERGGAKPTCGSDKPKRDVGTMWHPKITWKEMVMLAENEDYQEYLDIVAKMPKGTPLDTMTVEDGKRVARERYL